MKIIFIITLIISGSTLASTDYYSNDLKGKVTGPGVELGVKNLEDLLNIGKLNDDIFLFESAKKKLGVKDDKDLLKYIKFCTKIELDTRSATQGLYFSPAIRTLKSLKTSEEKNWDTNKYENSQSVFKIIELEDEIFFKLKVVKNPKICIRKNLTLFRAYLVLVHELVHFNNSILAERFDDFSYLKFNSFDEYINAELLSSGGEFEAFKAAAKTSHRLKNTFLHLNQNYHLEALLSESGELLNEESLKSYILEDLNYKNKFIKRFKTKVPGQYKKLKKSINAAKENLIHIKNNINIYESNLKIYKSRPKLYKGKYAKTQKTLAINTLLHRNLLEYLEELTELQLRAQENLHDFLD